MVRLTDWLQRTWSFDLPVGVFPAVLERLRGTPARVRALVAEADEVRLRARPGSAWSALDHLGHLDDLHELDTARLDQFLARAETLVAADMSNARTESARHHTAPVAALVDRFSRRRLGLVDRMEVLTEAEVGRVARHPRLGRGVRLIDWAQFVADHDDHHLAKARAALRS